MVTNEYLHLPMLKILKLRKLNQKLFRFLMKTVNTILQQISHLIFKYQSNLCFDLRGKKPAAYILDLVQNI